MDLLAIYPLRGRIWIAYSGGVDSHVLLHLTARLKIRLQERGLELRALHIHHGLSPQADFWAEHCQRVCQALAINCEMQQVKVQAQAGESVEAAARQVRYAAFQACLGEQEAVLTAHHADDQAETMLLQLLRGAGTAGLSAMPAHSRLEKGWLLRPLLSYSHQQIQDYARHLGLSWIEDHSNQDCRFDRNFLRQAIIPRLKSRWPQLQKTLSRAAAHQAQAETLLQELADIDLQHCLAPLPKVLHFLVNQPLSLTALAALSPARRDNAARAWLRRQGFLPPSTAQLRQITQGITAVEDRQPTVRWRGGETRRYRDYLFALPPLPAPSPQRFRWQPPETLALPWGILNAQAVQGEGLRVHSGSVLTVQFRRGGESCRLRGHHHPLKKLFQEIGLPPWLRQLIPLIYVDGALAAVPGVLICDGFAAQAHQSGWLLGWQIHHE